MRASRRRVWSAASGFGDNLCHDAGRQAAADEEIMQLFDQDQARHTSCRAIPRFPQRHLPDPKRMGKRERTAALLPRHRAVGRRGFTLVELLAVIAMIGVLAAIATVGYRKYLHGAHTSEAKAVMGAIRIAEESRRAETLQYVDCGTVWYPSAPNGNKWHWINPGHANFACWQALNVINDSPTMFGFIVRAGAPGAVVAVVQGGWTDAPTWPGGPNEPWYTIEARGDSDGNGVQSRFVASSFNGEIYVENEHE